MDGGGKLTYSFIHATILVVREQLSLSYFKLRMGSSSARYRDAFALAWCHDPPPMFLAATGHDDSSYFEILCQICGGEEGFRCNAY